MNNLETLSRIYSIIHNQPGWYIKCTNSKLFSHNDVKILEDMDNFMSFYIPKLKKENDFKCGKNIKDFVCEYNQGDPDWVKRQRILFLDQELGRLAKKSIEIANIVMGIDSSVKKRMFLASSNHRELYIKYKSYLKELQYLQYDNTKQRVTEWEIDRAMTYPIDKLLNVKRGKALCVFHSENNPSMDCRGNFYYCYTCGATGNVIQLFMHMHGLQFVDAVKMLNRI